VAPLRARPLRALRPANLPESRARGLWSLRAAGGDSDGPRSLDELAAERPAQVHAQVAGTPLAVVRSNHVN
jgi:hypothetical protein